MTASDDADLLRIKIYRPGEVSIAKADAALDRLVALLDTRTKEAETVNIATLVLREVRRLCLEGHGDDLIAATVDDYLSAPEKEEA